MRTILTLLALVTLQPATSLRAAKKCCAGEKFFNSTSMRCETKSADVDFDSTNLKDNLLDLGPDPEVPIGFPSCPGSRMKALNLDPEQSKYRVSDDGHLVSVRSRFFETSVDLGDFCTDVGVDVGVDVDVDVANSTTGSEIALSNLAVICDPCAVDHRFCVR